MANTTLESLRQNLKARRAKNEKWREIATDYPGVAYGTLSRIVHDDSYEPKDNAIRISLGLPPRAVTVTPCAVCGSTRHTQHRERKPDPVIRIKRLRELLQSPYLMS